jgi:chromosome segregation ATPase
MGQDSELRRLEQFVEKLLVRFSELRAEQARLLKELAEREQQIIELRTNISSKEIERSEISQRVNRIVEQIEEWEMGLDEGEQVESTADALTEPEVVEEETLPGKNNAGEHRGEEEGRVQPNLFSIAGTHR